MRVPPSFANLLDNIEGDDEVGNDDDLLSRCVEQRMNYLVQSG